MLVAHVISVQYVGVRICEWYWDDEINYDDYDDFGDFDLESIDEIVSKEG